MTGATIRPSDDIQWVHAPHCHAIPVLRTAERTRLEIHQDPNAQGLRRLGRLSPLFRRLWNEQVDSGHVNLGGKASTFQIVCPLFQLKKGLINI